MNKTMENRTMAFNMFAGEIKRNEMENNQSYYG